MRTSLATGATNSILERLKTETSAEHEAIEGVLALTTMTRDTYRHWLERLFGFYVPVEARLLGIGAESALGLDLNLRSKVPLLTLDLRALGVDGPDRLPVCSVLPPLSTAADGFGCLYVLEGSTLGGQVISRHVRASLAITPDHGGSFFRGYGDETPRMWRAFGSALTAFAQSNDLRDRVVATAKATFRTLHQWFGGRT